MAVAGNDRVVSAASVDRVGSVADGDRVIAAAGVHVIVAVVGIDDGRDRNAGIDVDRVAVVAARDHNLLNSRWARIHPSAVTGDHDLTSAAVTDIQVAIGSVHVASQSQNTGGAQSTGGEEHTGFEGFSGDGTPKALFYAEAPRERTRRQTE